jgi:hypothetical protein
MSQKFPGMKIAGVYSPPFSTRSHDESAIIERINDTQPDIVWVGLGCPKQEKWMLANVGRIDAPAMIGVGAAFDFHSGVVKWAPKWIRKSGMEWLFRLALEPRRMWRRNFRGMQFATLVMQQAMGKYLWPTIASIAGTLAPHESQVRLANWVAKTNQWFDEEMEATPAPPAPMRIADLTPPRIAAQKAA